MTRVPLLVIGGYLGAGKTTLIRHLLRQPNGRRLLILVNDFGTINIDAELIAEADGETIALSNGCVCCAMTGDLYYAVGDALDRQPRPDAIIIEASGIGDPARLATLALAEPDLSHAGIVTVVDAETIDGLVADPQIGAQLAGQISAADLIALTRTDRAPTDPALAVITGLTDAPHLATPHGVIDPEILFGLTPDKPGMTENPHHASAFASWSGEHAGALASDALMDFLKQHREGLFRIKGWIRDETGTREVHRVGDHLDLQPSRDRPGTRLVAIGPAGRFNPDRLEQDWQALTTA